VWDEASRRVVDLESIALAELGRPRIDVTVRISGSSATPSRTW
jgi:cobaltochelatase CobN